MENQQEKINVNVAEGVSEIIIRHGDAPKVLDPKAPLEVRICGTLNAVAEYLKKRIDTGQFKQENCTITVNRENVSIVLLFNERDAYSHGTVSGRLQMTPDFKCLHINDGHVWAPTELAMLLKMHRYWFKDRAECMRIVSLLMNYTATVNQKIEQSIKENGSGKDNFEQVVNSNLPESITLNVPIFKGYQPEALEIEFFAKVDGRDVSFTLLSAGANESLETIRNTAIDAELAKIKEIAPNIAIIEE